MLLVPTDYVDAFQMGSLISCVLLLLAVCCHVWAIHGCGPMSWRQQLFRIRLQFVVSLICTILMFVAVLCSCLYFMAIAKAGYVSLFPVSLASLAAGDSTLAVILSVNNFGFGSVLGISITALALMYTSTVCTLTSLLPYYRNRDHYVQ
jgi:hypothetical protein